MKRILLFTLALVNIHASAQLESSNWFFGINAGIKFTSSGPVDLPGGQISQSEGCATISDANGSLLFYSNGITVWDKNHNIMPNGSGILGGQSSTQSCIIVPDPGNSSKYYLFTAPEELTTNPVAYSIVDMTLNGGNGDVTSTKNVTVFGPACEKLTAVYHSNGTDVWIVCHEWQTNNFRSYLLTSSGLSSSPVISSVGSVHGGADGNVIGYMKASPCGDKLAAAVWQDDFLELFDFNNTTGDVSNAIALGSWTAGSGVYGLEFSPDDSKLYASIITPGITVQWNLAAGNAAAIIASADTIGTSSVNFNGALQTGPDARIYLVKLGSSTLDCIKFPNVAGSGCSYTVDYVSFSGQGQLGLPDFFSSFFCNIESANEPETDAMISISPNPVTNVIHISLSNHEFNSAVELVVYNSLGQLLFEKHWDATPLNSNVTVPVTGWSEGVYFIRAGSNSKSYLQEFVVE